MPRKIGYELDSLDIKIQQPIEQNFAGKNGVYTVEATSKRWMSVKTYYNWATSERYKTPEHVDYDDLDEIYWKNINKKPAAIYGTDIDATLTDPNLENWNLNNLGTILNDVREDYGLDIRGLINSFVYFGMWKSSFVWHTEDMDLYAINYIHFGAPKTWYAIPPSHARKFEALADLLFPNEKENCNAHLRHKRIMISPDVLKQNDIPYVKTVHKAGEFLVVFPFAYHAGYNHGFNAAEVVNFATRRWIDYGKWANPCYCDK